MITQDYNHARYQPGQTAGHYESYFQRANHPTRPLALWIRYTLFSPAGRPQDAIGEIWGVFFNGESGRHCVVKQEFPISRCEFRRDRLGARIGACELGEGFLRGEARSQSHALSWDLSYRGGQPPVFLLPRDKYSGGFPRAKSLVGVPMAEYTGTLQVDGEDIRVDGWIGSQNHNWGSRHTDSYAWGQVCGFDNAPGSFLEVASARLKVGPVWTPVITPLVLRHAGSDYVLNSISQSIFRARGRFGYFNWQFRSRRHDLEIEGEIAADKNAFAGLRYYNPPGGVKYCLNTKIASCRLSLSRPGKSVVTLETRHRAAFEILTDDTGHGVEIRT